MPTIFRDKITVGDVTFNDPLDEPLGGIIHWGLDVLDGWHTTPELDANFTPLGSIDGEIAADFFASRGKQLTVGGYVNCVDRATAETVWDLIVRDAFPRNVELSLARYETTPKQMFVRRNGPIEPFWVGPMAFRWGVPLRAADPFKYSLTTSTDDSGVAGHGSGGRVYPRTYPLTYTTTFDAESESAVINNTGTAESSRFVVNLHGTLPSGSYRIVNETTGEFLKPMMGLASTDTATIDFHTQLITLSGYSVQPDINGDFWRLVPGVNVIKLEGTFHPLATMSVTAYSAWE
jgi:Phage tail protein